MVNAHTDTHRHINKQTNKHRWLGVVVAVVLWFYSFKAEGKREGRKRVVIMATWREGGRMPRVLRCSISPQVLF